MFTLTITTLLCFNIAALAVLVPMIIWVEEIVKEFVEQEPLIASWGSWSKVEEELSRPTVPTTTPEEDLLAEWEETFGARRPRAVRAPARIPLRVWPPQAPETLSEPRSLGKAGVPGMIFYSLSTGVKPPRRV